MGSRLTSNSLPAKVAFTRKQVFENGDLLDSAFSLDTEIKIKRKKQRKWRLPDAKEKATLRAAVYSKTPDIAYFPTFVFDFPQKIYLSQRGGKTQDFYKSVFQDILDYDGHGHTIEGDILRRIRSEPYKVPWLEFYSAYRERDDKEKIQHVMDRASSAVTECVFAKWNKIFHEDAGRKEVIISHEIVEGEVVTKGVRTKTDEHDIYVTFGIKDGTRRFDINSRSLGFRWFFAFMLFTQFRVARQSRRPILFLFDEPASNLHAAAQQKLIESFPEVARGSDMMVYTTHSHYMIEPKWLEQTFIVTNRSDAPSSSIIENVSFDDESLDIQVETYRSFVNTSKNKTSYFQPILDRLEVVPSRFDFGKGSVIVEGKSDYYILRYCLRLLEESDIAIIPGLGAATFSSLAALSVGWNLNSIFLLDGDKAGVGQKERYSRDFGIPEARLVLLKDLASDLEVIEDVVDADAIAIIKGQLEKRGDITKSDIRRFFQERLASDQIDNLGPRFRTLARTLIDRLKGLVSDIVS